MARHRARLQHIVPPAPCVFKPSWTVSAPRAHQPQLRRKLDKRRCGVRGTDNARDKSWQPGLGLPVYSLLARSRRRPGQSIAEHRSGRMVDDTISPSLVSLVMTPPSALSFAKSNRSRLRASFAWDVQQRRTRLEQPARTCRAHGLSKESAEPAFAPCNTIKALYSTSYSKGTVRCMTSR